MQSVVTPSLERSGDYHILRVGPREYRVGGLDKNNSLEVMKISLRLLAHRTGSTFSVQGSRLSEEESSKPGTVNGEPGTEADALFHYDVLDLLQDQHRRKFIERAAEETRLEKDLVKRDMGKLLLLLERTAISSVSCGACCCGNIRRLPCR